MDEKNQDITQPQEDLENLETAGENKEQEAEQPVEAAQSVPESPKAPEPSPTPDKKGNKNKSFLKGNKFKRGSMATVMTVIFIAVVVVVNLLVSLLSDRFPSMNMDLTAQKMNTLSDQAVEVAGNVEKETTIYLIGQEDAYRNNAIYSSYGLKYSQVANLAERLEEANSHIHTEFVDPDTNPEFISSYADENLMSGSVLVATEKRYRALTVDDLFGMTRNSSTGATETYSKVDSGLAAAIEIVNMDKVPVLTVATGHGELLTSSNMGYFLDMMERQNFEVKEINILTDEIPEDTQILMIPAPTTDYTEDEINKLRSILENQDREESLSVLATFHPTQGELPRLQGFLEEWGVQVQTGAVVAETDTSRYVAANPSYVMVDQVGEWLDENSYSRLISPQSVPLKVLFEGNGEVSADEMWATSGSAYVVTQSTTDEEMENPDTAQQTVATLSASLVQFGNNIYYRSMIVFGSSYVFTDGFMETAFDNSTFMTDLLNLATNMDGSKVSVFTERVQTNVMDITASQNTIMVLGLGVFTIGLPVIILALGLVIFLKRRHL